MSTKASNIICWLSLVVGFFLESVVQCSVFGVRCGSLYYYYLLAI